MRVCGIDEAGRGPLAGPVTAAAVILPETFITPLTDSKKLSPGKRSSLAILIWEKAISIGVGWAWNEEIDVMNIHRATLLAMVRAIRNLTVKPHKILVDGSFTPKTSVPCRAVIKGDTFVPSIQAASIIAKTERDRWMIRYSRIEPDYLFDKNKGYPTREHRTRIKLFGLSPIHRKTFNIVFPV